MNELNVGTSLTELERAVTQEDINAYAKASRDFNPIHVDLDFAKNTRLGLTVAHGMLILAYLSEFMTENFGKRWLIGGSLSARFKEAAYPGDIITVTGKVIAIEKEDDSTYIECDVLCQNQKDEPIIICSAKVNGKNDENSN